MAAHGFKLKSGNPHILPFDETSGSANDWYANDPVKLSSGRLVIADNGTILGIAQSAATGTEDARVNVSLVDPTQVWEADYIGTLANTGTGVEAALDFTPNASGVATGGTGDVIILKDDERDGYGANKRVLVRFQATACQSIA